MRHVVHHLRSTTLSILTACIFELLAQRAGAADLVDDLRQAMIMRSDEMINPTPAVLKSREEILKKRIDALKSPGELRRALTLSGWRGDPAADEKIRQLDQRMRQLVGARFLAAVRGVVKDGDANSRLALANMIAEMGPTVQPLGQDFYGLARSLAPELLILAQDKDLGVRQEALRALGNINAKPSEVVPALIKTLQADVLGPRRIAADSLAQLVRVASHLQRRGRTETGVEIGRLDVIEAVEAVIPAASTALSDADSQVRSLCLEVFNVSGQAMADLVPDPFARNYFPPKDRPISDAEKKEINDANRLLRLEMGQFDKVLVVFQKHGPVLADALKDPLVSVRLADLGALESISQWRLRILRRINSVPAPQPMPKAADKKEQEEQAILADDLKVQDPLEHFFQPGLPAMAELLSDPDARVRRGVVDVLETMETSAAPVIPVLIRALHDADRFVRWAAARALGNIAPEKSAPAVPSLAKLLADPDLSVRLAAATTLENMGPLAKEAVAAASQAISVGDAESRISAVKVILGIGPQHTQLALPHLIEALDHVDARVRRTAAEALGKFGPAARIAVPALRRLLGDEDTEVRIHASDATLSILPPSK